MLSPAIGLTSPRALFSPADFKDLTLSPTSNCSPYRLPPIPKSISGNDLVSGIVDKFNSLSVTDRDEERSMYERQIAKLKAALDRACMAREEAESEARRLRERLLEMQDETNTMREELMGRVGEWERKYDKAKERFKSQRVKNEEAMRKVETEHLEKEKGHWRAVAFAQESEDWERQLRNEAHDLLKYIELEQRFAEPRRLVSRRTITTDVVAAPPTLDKRTPKDSRDPPSISLLTIRPDFRGPSEEQDRSERFLTPEEHTIDTAIHIPDSRDVTPDGPPSIPIIPFRASHNPVYLASQSEGLLDSPPETHDSITPARQILRVPVDFGGDIPTGDEDKENAAPRRRLVVQQPATCGPTLMRAATTPAAVMTTPHRQQHGAAPQTPVTIDRAAALAAIEYRRGRAKSFVGAGVTPRNVSGSLVGDKRDLSAPVVTMSVVKSGGARC